MSPEQVATLITVIRLLVESGILTAALVLAKGAIERRLGPERARAAAQIAGDVTRAVEQLARARGWAGQEKLDKALDQARALGAAHGIALDDEQWRSLIEAAVHEIGQLQRALRT